jgi:hypothetical protein
MELQRRQSGVRTLERARDRLMSKLSKLEGRISDYGGAVLGALRGRARGAAAGGVRRRPKNDMNLVDSLSKVLKGRTMSVTDVTQAVQDAGYRTSSANFRTIVNQTLINSGRFRKVSRGKYTAK